MAEPAVILWWTQSASGHARHGRPHTGVSGVAAGPEVGQNDGARCNASLGVPIPMMRREQQKDFEDLEASLLYCPTCKRPMPVRKRLFLVLLDKEIFDYICTACGAAVGKKEQPWRRPAQWSRI